MSASVAQASPASDSDADSEDAEADSDSEPSQLVALAGSQNRSEEEQVGRQQGSHGVHVGAKAWRGQLKEWLGFVGGMKGARGMFRSDDLKQCVVKHLLDTDSGVQQAALKALQVASVYAQVLSICH